MPTPVKYYNEDIKDAYKEVEAIAEKKLLNELPNDLRPEFEKLYRVERTEEELYMRRLVKAADKLSAYIKCIEEDNSGNKEFRSAKTSIEKKLAKMSEELPEVGDFMKDFIPSYGKTLDELTGR